MGDSIFQCAFRLKTFYLLALALSSCQSSENI